MCTSSSTNMALNMKHLAEIRDMNFEVLNVLSSYLNECPCYITKDTILELIKECETSEENAFCAMLLAACGADTENNSFHHKIAELYFTPAVKKLSSDTYRQNFYFRNIHIPNIKFGHWKLTYETYQPYEAFVYDDLLVTPEFIEIPHIGFFNQEFKFPAVMENDIEWMTIKPNEIETMTTAINTVKGNVVTFGLGLGYFTYMVSLKEDVNNITVIEKDNEVIELFRTHILPQFQYASKIHIIKSDAFDFAEKEMPASNFDYAFVDLWHDVSDGFKMYIRMKKMEHLCPHTQYLYWIETSLLSHLRWILFNRLENAYKKDYKSRLSATCTDIYNYLCDDSLKKLITVNLYSI